MMKKVMAGILMAVAISILSGCMVNPLMGPLYTNATFHAGDHNQEIGSKQGESCATNILGLIATGDASVSAAANKAGITKITSIDYRVTNVLGLFGTFCVIVTGE